MTHPTAKLIDEITLPEFLFVATGSAVTYYFFPDLLWSVPEPGSMAPAEVTAMIWQQTGYLALATIGVFVIYACLLLFTDIDQQEEAGTQ